MDLVALVVVAAVAGVAGGTLAWRWSGRTRGIAPPAGRWAGRMDPHAATGLALTVALAVIVLGGVVLGVLAYLVRGHTEVVELDSSVAQWGHDHGSALSTDVLDAITHAGQPSIVTALALIVGAAWFCVCASAFGGRLLRFGAPAERAEQAEALAPSR
jgi:hypothetical protein